MNWCRSMRSGTFCTSLVICALAWATGHASDEPNAATKQSNAWVTAPDEELDEVVVTATQAKLRQLREAAEKAEDAFYERYSEVNKNELFDVHCHVDREGRFRRHRCVGVYVERAEQSDAIELMVAASHCSPDGGPVTSEVVKQIVLTGGCGYIPMARVIEDGRRKEFAESMLRAMKSDVRLRELARSKEQLDRQIQETRAKLFGKEAR